MNVCRELSSAIFEHSHTDPPRYAKIVEFDKCPKVRVMDLPYTQKGDRLPILEDTPIPSTVYIKGHLEEFPLVTLEVKDGSYQFYATFKKGVKRIAYRAVKHL